MKKIFILIITFTLILITGSNTFAIDTYGYNLNMPLSEFDGYSLREVFENRNMAMPDLTGKTEISPGLFRLTSFIGITIDYNVNDGEYVINGLSTTASSYPITDYIYSQNDYVLTYYGISGTKDAFGQVSLYSFTGNPSNDPSFNMPNISDGTITSLSNYTVFGNIRRLNFYTQANVTYNNYTFKLQLEIGSITTPYQIPTNGPYSDIDVGQFSLTLQQIEYYFDIYIQLQFPYYNTFFDNIIISINNITNHAESTIQQTFDYLYDGENLTHTGQIVTIFFSTALIASILILLFRSWRF